ncbi:hypothetical protein J6590_027520 [Homalodisca vitripennis]|nr:hypothetical protein J6590_027520 [Homalodisca vitripennis]
MIISPKLDFQQFHINVSYRQGYIVRVGPTHLWRAPEKYIRPGPVIAFPPHRRRVVGLVPGPGRIVWKPRSERACAVGAAIEGCSQPDRETSSEGEDCARVYVMCGPPPGRCRTI